MRETLMAGAVMAAAAAPAICDAAVIDFEGGGLISSSTIFRPPSLSSVAVGDAFTISFTLDTGVADADGSSIFGRFPGAVTDIVYRIPDRGIELTAASADFQTFIFNDNHELRFQVGDIIDGYVLNFWLRDRTGTALAESGGDVIPSVIDLSDFAFLKSVIIYEGAIPTGGSTAVSSALDTLVPEPAAGALLGLTALALVTRRHRSV